MDSGVTMNRSTSGIHAAHRFAREPRPSRRVPQPYYVPQLRVATHVYTRTAAMARADSVPPADLLAPPPLETGRCGVATGECTRRSSSTIRRSDPPVTTETPRRHGCSAIAGHLGALVWITPGTRRNAWERDVRRQGGPPPVPEFPRSPRRRDRAMRAPWSSPERERAYL